MKRTMAMRFGWATVFAGLAITGASLAWARGGPPRALWQMHEKTVLEFIDSEGFGARRMPAMQKVMGQPVEGTRMYMADLQLIGVAMHRQPRAFDFEMDVFHQQNKEIPRERTSGRAITADEARALRELDAGKRLVVENEGRGLRVVGAIRAGSECLGCHKNKRAGDMLGAFVYRLAPMPETPK